MDKSTSRLLLENLLDRVVVDPETGQGTLAGVLTPKEIEALKMASTLLTESGINDSQSKVKLEPLVDQLNDDGNAVSGLDSTPKGKAAEDVVTDSEVETELKLDLEQKTELNLTSLNFATPQDPETRMCLDFGTAMSKAFASIIENDEIVNYMSLQLGRRASSNGTRSIYPVPSSLWISNEGKIYLGEKAIILSLQEPSKNRERFDSLKKELILGMKESSPFNQQMRESLNPTKVPLSTGSVITLYLGYLTDLACTELEEVYKCSRYVLRNFALPSWAPERREWGETLLKNMLIKAQIVADTFHGKWDDGLSITDVKSVLEKVDKLDAIPDYLVSKGITEPLAVGSSRLRQEEKFRGLAMVVDVGAGTSDLALFVVVENPERNLFNAFPVLGCNQSLHMAGDTLDTALRKMILDKSGISKDDSEYTYINQHLRLQVRTLKENLFRDGYCIVNLENGARIRIEQDEYLCQDSVLRFEQSLFDKLDEILKSIKIGLSQTCGRGGLSVVLTGGGATLPMVKKLTRGNFNAHGIQILKYEVPLVPEAFERDQEIADVYPQLAVAIGGTMPVLIDEKDALDDLEIPQGQFILNRTAMTGI